MRTINALLVLFGIFALVAPALAQPQRQKVKAQLLADTTAVVPGKPFNVGVLFKMDPRWHIYWTNPGDSGEPTEVEWKLPEGFTASPVRYPLPKRFTSPGDILGIGYENEVLLTATITPPQELPGSTVDLGATATWLVCDDVCIPGDADLKLTLPVAKEARPSPQAELFKTWAARVPHEMPEDTGGRIVSVSQQVEPGADGADVTLSVKWRKEKPEMVGWLPPFHEKLQVTDLRITTDDKTLTTKVLFKVKPLPGQSLPQETLRSVFSWSNDDGSNEQSIVLPFDPSSGKAQAPAGSKPAG